jgi:L-ascorbate metabolism protein UlaG (beta-lactamase superfamily)
MDDGVIWEGAGVKITAIKAAHEFFDLNDCGYPHLSYVIESGCATFLHSGDACVYEGLVTRLRRWQYTLVTLPVNGRDAVRLKRGCQGNMTYQEAADLAGVLAATLTVPGHFDMFANNSVDPQLFADYMNVKYPRLRHLIPQHGVKVEVRP